jgi:tetratricopeptide (TPR) repeat protein
MMWKIHHKTSGPVRAFSALSLAVVLVAYIAVGATAEEGGIWEGRTVLGQADRALRAAAQAATKQDAEATQKQQKKAQELFEKARTLFEEGGIDESEEVDAIVDYAKILQVFGDIDLAIAALERTVKLNPDDATCWTRLGRVLTTGQAPRPEEAEKALKQSIALDSASPASADAYAILGKLYWDQGLYEFAQEHFDKAVERNDKQWLGRIGQAAVIARTGRVLEASKALDAVASAAPSSYAQMALTQMLPKALQDFRKAGRWFDDTAENHAAYGALLLRGGLYAESLEPLERAVKLDPQNHVAWNMLGSISAQMGRKDRAMEAFRRSLAIKPDQTRTQASLRALEAESPKEQTPQP